MEPTDNNNAWTISIRRSYPYTSIPIKVPSPTSDRYKRNIASLLHSIGTMSKKITNSTLTQFTMEDINRIARVCTNGMTMDDYLHFFIQLYEEPTRATSRIVHLNILESDGSRDFANMSDLAQYEDIILSCISSTGNIVLFLILPSLSTVEAFCPTPISYDDVQDTLNSLLAVLSLSFGKPFTIRLRLQVPQNFHRDPLFTALFLIGIIDRREKYYQATEASLLKYKLYMIRDFIHVHDNFLGKIDLGNMTKSSHPFYKTRRAGDQFDRIESKGWHVMDVKGDGNCGYYALLLALQNVGIMEYFVDTKSMSRKARKVRWERLVVSLRQRLKEGSEELLSTVFPPESPNRGLEYWATVLGTFSAKDQIELSNSFVIPGKVDPSVYFADDFTDDDHYQMNPYWSAIVIAHVFKVRVVIITRTSSPKENATSESDVDYTHSTSIFDFDDQFEADKDKYIPVKSYPNCYRVSDVSFHTKPTIELLYITGFKSLGGGADDNHFLFLRRVLCVKVHPSLPISETALRNFIIAQQDPDNDAMEIDIESPTEATTTTTTEKEIPRKEAPDPASPGIDKQSNPVDKNQVNTVAKQTMETVDPASPGIDKQSNPVDKIQVDTVAKQTMETVDNNAIQSVEPTTDSTMEPLDEAMIPMEIDHETATEPSRHSTSNGVQAKDRPASTLNSGQECKDTDNEEIEDDTFDNVMYDDKRKQFFTGRFDSNLRRYLQKTVIEDTATIEDELLEDARSKPNTWITLPLGDPGDDPPPEYLTTKVKCLYEQLEKPYCVTYCVASALFYCGFDYEARKLAAQAPILARVNMNVQIESIQSFLPNLVPLIGGCTIYGKRCSGNNKRKRQIDWNDLFRNLTPYPTLVVPVLKSNGRRTHAICVVDDLIFDSSSSHALKLKEEAIDWIFNNEPVDIFVAIRFNQKVSPEGQRIRGVYNRPVKTNWNPANEPNQTWESVIKHKSRRVKSKVYDLEYSVMPIQRRFDIIP